MSKWLIPTESAPINQGDTVLAGGFGALAAGADWLALAMAPVVHWSQSVLSMFHIGETGLSPLTVAPVALKGMINDQYKIQWRAGVLTTIA